MNLATVGGESVGAPCRRNCLGCGLSRPPARYFSLLRQRKVSQRKAARRLAPIHKHKCLWIGVPCASRENRRLLNSRSRYARPLKHTQASSGFHCDARLRLRGLRSTPPVALTEYRSQSGEQARTMFEAVYGAGFMPRKLPSCARPPDWRGTQGTGVAGECSGGPSLWVLSLGQARESTSQCGRESPHQIQLAPARRSCERQRLAAAHRLAVIQPGRPLRMDGDVNTFIACLCL